jgi:hypothetical protein
MRALLKGSHPALAVPLAWALILSFSPAVAAQQTPGPATSPPVTSPEPAKPVAPRPIPGPVVPTRYQLTADLKEVATPVHHKLVAVLEKANPIPPSRHKRFAYYVKGPAIVDGSVYWSRITRWGVMVEAIEERPDGWLITARVSPSYETSRGGGGRVLDYYYEYYHVTPRGAITLMGTKEGTGGWIAEVH